MKTAFDIVAFAVGVVIVVTTLLSAIRATILPRGVQSRLTGAVTLGVRAGFRLASGRAASYARRDRAMAMLGPVSLLALLLTWLVLLLVAYGLMYLAVATTSVARAIELSGSSITTLGTTATGQLFADLLTYSEAGLGLLLVTMLITYLPSIYGAFSRRENGVALLEVRAGDPPQATTMLIRYHRIEMLGSRLTELWRRWEEWFADVEESHTSFPTLAFFRSPQPHQSWITAAGTVLDAASLWVAAVDHEPDPDAQLCLRAGFLCLRRVANVFSVPYPADPQPADPITIARVEFDAAWTQMTDAGMTLRPDRDAAWEAFRGWRVNYDTVLLNLARLVEAPPAPWVSDRTPLRSEQTWSVRGALVSAAGRPSGRGRWSGRRDR